MTDTQSSQEHTVERHNGCPCEMCCISRDFANAVWRGQDAAEVAYALYWSLTCVRCGARVKYEGPTYAMCEACDAIDEARTDG
jgi:hypothetical protein